MESKKSGKNNLENENNLEPGRRGFLKSGATLGAALLAAPALGKGLGGRVSASNNGISERSNITKKRTLGSGNHRLEVSALGLVVWA